MLLLIAALIGVVRAKQIGIEHAGCATLTQ